MPAARSERRGDETPAIGAEVERLSVAAVMREFADEVLSLHRGMPWTLAQLLVRPGWAIRRYVEQRDPRLTRPFRLAVVCLSLAAVVMVASDARTDFAAGFVEGAGGSDSASARWVARLLDHAGWLLLACWAPAVGGAMQRAYPALGLNAAEGFVFGLYTLVPLLLVVALLEVGRVPGVGGWALLVAAPLMLGHAAFGYARPAGFGIRRALLFVVLAMLLLALALLMAAFALVASAAVLG